MPRSPESANVPIQLAPTVRARGRLAAIIDHWVPPTARTDWMRLRRARLLVGALLLGTAALVGFAVSQAASGLPLLAGVSLGAGALLAALLTGYRRTDHHLTVTHITLALAFVGMASTALSTGGLYSFTIPVLAVLPLFAFALAGPRAAAFWVTAAGLTIGALFVVELAEVDLPTHTLPSEVPDQVFLNLLVLMVYTFGLVYWLHNTNRLQQQALEAATRKAQAASAAKSAFLANMSHELRTPMNGVIGLTELTLVRAQLDDTDAATLQTVLRSGRTMVRLLDDLLDLGRVEAGKVVLESVPTHLGDLVDEVAALMSERARQQEVDLRLKVDPGVDWGRGDPARLRQVVLNLVGNAVKFTQAGTVTIRAHREGDTVQVAVEDTGIGIDDAALPTLFDPFVQADASTTRRFGGSGLGLAICRRLVARMGGHIDVESVPGQGSTFRFSVDLPRCDPPIPEVTPEVDTRSVAGLRVLVAEDNPVNRTVVRRQLDLLGVESVLAVDGEDALRQLANDHYDAVFMDLHMPRLDGLAASNEARRKGFTGPIIAMTASGLPEDRAAARQAGMTGFIVKPVRVAALTEVLGRVRGR